MAKLIVFNQVSLDGFISDEKGDMNWAHRDDAEWKAFSAENAKGDARLLFGRVTYEMMARFWPTPGAMESLPAVATRMNSLPKVVFSRTLTETTWNNTKLVKTDIAGEVRSMKKEAGPQMVILGSGSIVSQLAQEGLVDEFQIVVNPIVLGKGKSMFSGVKGRLNLRPTKTRTFANGNILLHYEPVA
jgi:dihydrofolate reductase